MTKNLDSQWSSHLMDNLQDTIDDLVIFGKSNNGTASVFSTLAIDFSDEACGNALHLNSSIIDTLKNGGSLILLNVQDPEYLSGIIGFGIAGKCVIVRQLENYLLVNALGIEESGSFSHMLSTLTRQSDGSQCSTVDGECRNCCQKCDNDSALFYDLCVDEQARLIANILYSNFEAPDQSQSGTTLKNTPSALPLHQYKLIYLAIEGQWQLGVSQVTNNSVIMEISLIASYNPQYKYLRIRSLGAGFNPTNGGPMQSDSKYDRAFFQSAVNIHLEPLTDRIRTLSTEPKNVNNRTQYTAGSEFSVGVDISKDPGFSASYSISQSKTTEISDFNVYNNSSGTRADWNFKLTMTENSIWDIFTSSFLRKDQVKALPALATKNLQPVTETVWYGDNTLNDNIPIQLFWRVDHYGCWVTGDWQECVRHYQHYWRTVGFVDQPFYINFASVYA